MPGLADGGILMPLEDSLPFTRREYDRRRTETLALAAQAGADTVISFGENRSGAAITYLTGWPVTRLAVHRLSASESRMWVQFHNHTPLARRIAVDTEVCDVDDGFLSELLADVTVVATLGSVPSRVATAAAERGVALKSIDAAHAQLRQIKSEEEAQALRLGAQASDIGARALIDACSPGASDWDLLAAARSAYSKAGARDHICYIGITDMADPDRDVPSQFPEGRVLRRGSVVTFELSAAVAPEYPGQILRTVTLGEPTEQYQHLHSVADRARAAVRDAISPGRPSSDLVDASHLIEEAGCTTTDDLFHGLGMGYLEPIGTSTSRVPMHRPSGNLASGMAIVVQPNVTSLDHRAGVQTGEMVLVADTGCEDIHSLEPGIIVRRGGA